eukprot:CAMPEP_0201560746 /NCGR_PEP_ID=MMETSP0173_2-20130828/78431_1 /ASSEMBLY_ACC=CAM_ASM_000268 /TAXON_ID=218659 /ORGANISM="Vexillifera sp., Strain DIVA3 564/2" /LENGTH=132 /DNA_ID=CAMNT_0047975205 /DNA_START=1073 /DNA_END=1471 /DNA_ORIENTATION=-
MVAQRLLCEDPISCLVLVTHPVYGNVELWSANARGFVDIWHCVVEANRVSKIELVKHSDDLVDAPIVCMAQYRKHVWIATQNCKVVVVDVVEKKIHRVLSFSSPVSMFVGAEAIFGGVSVSDFFRLDPISTC